MANINKIRLSGQTYNIQDLNASKTVELTQAQYDALTVKDPNTFYVITDAQGADLSNYYTKSETSGATEISTALASKADTATTYTKTEVDNAITAATSAKQDTLVSGTNIKTINNESILGSGNITIQGGGGGGKAIEAGRGISITTGETADTVSFNLPISAGTGTNSIREGYNTTAGGSNSHAEGHSSKANGDISHAEGYNTTASSYSHSEGYETNANGYVSHTEGSGTITNNTSEHASGQYNVSSKASNTFGDSGNTLFSVGNGKSSARHNAFEIRQNGDIYITSGGTDIKLQDNLGGGGGGGASYSAGDGIDITNNVISVTGKTDISAFTAHTADTVIHVTSAEKAAWNAKSDFSGSYNDLTDKPTIPTVPTSNTAFTNDAGYITSDAISGKADTSAVTESINAAVSGKVDTSAITTSITSSSTDAQVPSAKAVNDKLGGLSIVKLTESEYAALVTKDSDTLYVVVPDPSN